MKFGLDIAQQRVPWAELASRARFADELGFDGVWGFDHFQPMYGEGPGECFEGNTTLAALSGITEKVRLGLLVTGMTYRHPAVFAAEALTIDHASGGRLELSYGAAWFEDEHRRLGIPFPVLKDRVDAFEEAVQIVRGLLTTDDFTFEGRHFSVEHATLNPKPVQQPHPPIIVGGGGPKVLAVAAKHAQIVGINASLHRGTPEHPETVRSMTAAATDTKLEHLRDAAGDRFADLEIQTLTGFVHVTDDRVAIAAGMAAAFDVEPEVALETPAALVGTVDEMCADLEARRERWQMSYVVVPEEFSDAFAPVVARLAGT